MTGPGISSRDKIRVWSGTPYSIGMGSNYTFGALSDYAMSFQMNDQAGRGFWWGHQNHTNAQGAMSLTGDGVLTVASNIKVGYGDSNTTAAAHAIEVSGNVYIEGGNISTGGGDFYSSNGAFIANDGNGQFAARTGSNIDHFWHNDTDNAWIFNSDTTYKNNTGTSILKGKAFHAFGDANQMLLHPGGTSQTIILRNDGSNFYFLLSASGTSASGSWNADRPFRINNATGDVELANSKFSVAHDTGNLDLDGAIVAGGNITAFSDASLKENIEVIPNALDKVSQIRGVTFDRIDKDNVRQTGVIAQEVEEVLPEVVEENKDGIKSVAYGNMVGLLIESIKELKEENEKLRKRLDDAGL